jgi:hypothetical protein
MTDAAHYLSQEGLPFCLYDGAELAPSESRLGRCVECGTAWERVYSQDCPACESGWVHLPHPDSYSTHAETGVGEHAEGYGWCDSCGVSVFYLWDRPPVSRPYPYLRLRVASSGHVERVVSGDPEELVWAS